MRKIFVTVCLFVAAFSVSAQVDKKSELYKTIKSKDSLLFNVGFNTCDISQFDRLLSPNFEFFHDKDSISDKKTFIHNLRNGLCISPDTYQSRRELVAGSTEIYPLYKNKVLYGAVQMGVHKFYETIDKKKEVFGSTAKFTSVWLLENGQWQLNRCLSYDHQTENKNETADSFLGNDKEVEQWLKDNKVPALGLGIIENGKLQQIKVYGELRKGTAAPYNTLFNVASLTKPITAMVALQLVSLGKWDLDEPVYKYWTDPDIAKDPRNKKLTTRIILSHQTGFPNWRWMNADEKLNFQFDPGTKYQYSGEGFEYLRNALEKKFHKTLNQLASELIFEPLKMNDTSYIWTQNTDTSRVADGFDKEGKAYETVKNKTANAADDLLTTIEHYGRFLVSVMNGEGFSKKVFDDMKTNQVPTKNGKHFGLGLEIYDLEKDTIALSHGGADKGVQTIFFIIPKTKQGIIIFTNVDDGYKVYEKLLVHYLGDYGKKIVDIETK
jgi:CubicO group peptidase (beta-lactamase class C family)